jgi:release factor glutamine methyltransferase
VKTAGQSPPLTAASFPRATEPPAARAALAQGVARLEAARVASAALNAELLLLHALGRDRTWLYTHPEHAMSADEAAEFARLIEERAAGTPSQYLTGKQEFWGLEFEVTRDVLIPRPETEHVVEVALARLAARRGDALRVADVGTGSGCIAVALARELPKARVVATDVSGAALEVARRNAERLGVAERIEFRETNLLDAYLPGASGDEGFDLIGSNPPYVALGEAAALAREVREHEPHGALFGGETGAEIYPALIAQAEKLLRRGGALVVELGYDSAARVRPLVETSAWREIEISNDLAGIPRVLAAERT